MMSETMKNGSETAVELVREECRLAWQIIIMITVNKVKGYKNDCKN